LVFKEYPSLLLQGLSRKDVDSYQAALSACSRDPKWAPLPTHSSSGSASFPGKCWAVTVPEVGSLRTHMRGILNGLRDDPHGTNMAEFVLPNLSPGTYPCVSPAVDPPVPLAVGARKRARCDDGAPKPTPGPATDSDPAPAPVTGTAAVVDLATSQPEPNGGRHHDAVWLLVAPSQAPPRESHGATNAAAPDASQISGAIFSPPRSSLCTPSPAEHPRARPCLPLPPAGLQPTVDSTGTGSGPSMKRASGSRVTSSWSRFGSGSLSLPKGQGQKRAGPGQDGKKAASEDVFDFTDSDEK
jgi:hypothetical protein